LTALIIIGMILLIILVLLFTRICVHLEYVKKFDLSLYLGGIKFYPIKHKSNEKKSGKKADKKTDDKKDNFFKKLYKEKGIADTVKIFSYVIKIIAEKLLWLIKKLKIRKFNLVLFVVGDDAADTAIKYGSICSAIYPLIAFLDANLNFKAEKIDVFSDFEGEKSNISFSVDIKAEIIVLLAVAISALIEYKKIRDVFFDERKQH